MINLQRVQQSLCDLFTYGYNKKAFIIFLYLIFAIKIKGLSVRTIGHLLQMRLILPMGGMSTSITAMTIGTIRQIQIMFGVFELRRMM